MFSLLLDTHDVIQWNNCDCVFSILRFSCFTSEHTFSVLFPLLPFSYIFQILQHWSPRGFKFWSIVVVPPPPAQTTTKFCRKIDRIWIVTWLQLSHEKCSLVGRIHWWISIYFLFETICIKAIITLFWGKRGCKCEEMFVYLNWWILSILLLSRKSVLFF